MDEESYLCDGLIEYYNDKLEKFPDSPRAVDWKDTNAQKIRFDILSEVIQTCSNFSINDLGCGLGDYFAYLETKYKDFKYHGFDISTNMIEKASKRFENHNVKFSVSSKPQTKSDYTIASGIFSVAPNAKQDQWEERNFNIIDRMWNMSNRGIAFNMLSNFSQIEKRAPHLFYADAGQVASRLIEAYGCEMRLIYKPNLYEFSILMWRHL